MLSLGAPGLRRLLVPVLGALALAAPAGAAPGWTPATPLPSAAKPWTAAVVGSDATGTLTASHVEVLNPNPPYQTRASVSVRRAGSDWSDQLVADSTDTVLPISAQLAVGADGAAGVCIASLVGADPTTAPYRYTASVRPAGSSSWEAPAVLTTDAARSNTVTECHVAVSSDGTVAVLVERVHAADASNLTPYASLDLFVHPAGGAWSAAMPVSTSGRNVASGALAFDGSGDLTVAWSERFQGGTTSDYSDDRSALKVRMRSASNGVLGAAAAITGESATQSVSAPRLSVNASGRAVMAWQWGNPAGSAGDYQAWAASRSASGTTWSAPAKLVPDTPVASSAPGAVGVAPDGTSYVSFWIQGSSSDQDHLAAARRTPGGAWETAQRISPTRFDARDQALAFIGNDAIFAFSGTVGYGSPDAYRVLETARWPSGAAAPEAFRDLVSPGALTVQDLALAPDGTGGVLATWADWGSGTGVVSAADYDAAPPALLSDGVPGTAQVGVAVTLQAQFADLWSALAAGSPTWDFGDGTTGAGASVTHAWAAAGTYTVTVRGRDALGNERTKSYTVTVTAPPAGGPGPPGGGPAPDAQAPTLKLKQPACSKKLSKAKCQRYRRTRAAWRTLRGTVADAGGSGVARVEVAVARKVGKRYFVLKGKTFKRGTRSAFLKAFRRATVAKTSWRLALPRLKAGTYLLRVRASDKAGNTSKVIAVTLKLR